MELINTFLNPEVISAAWPLLMQGLWLTVKLSVIIVPLAALLGLVIAVPELLNVSSNIQSNIANPTAFTAGAILFCLIFFPFVYLTRVLERRYAIKS